MNSRVARRRIDGLLLLDKPYGLTSNAVLQQVKWLFNAHKAGHTGALDPMASGMLPICLGQATKFSQFLLEADKIYRVTAQLGVRTDTSDAQGVVISKRPVKVTLASLERALAQFQGEITQIPSCYSALKYRGKPRYHYARLGIKIPHKSRQVILYRVRLVDFSGDYVTLEIHCSKGTYIRTVIDDLGELLGCGAHVTALRRLQIAQHLISEMVCLEQLQASSIAAEQGMNADAFAALDALLLPIDRLAAQLPEMHLESTAAQRLQQGGVLPLPMPSTSGLVRLTVGPTRWFMGIGECQADQLLPKRLLIPTCPGCF